MNKNEFLKYLEKRFAVLNEKEREDILNEYAQHIDMKMKSGLSEEEAIKDFGNADELADEILSAYNVDPKYKNNGIDTDKVEQTISKGAVFIKDKALKTKKYIENNCFKNSESEDAHFWGNIFLWAVRIGVLFFVLPCFLFLPFTVVGFGVLFVLMILGYPAIGLTIGCLGFNLCAIAVLLVILKYVYFTKYFKNEVKHDEI